jgi:hypothetical protein
MYLHAEHALKFFLHAQPALKYFSKTIQIFPHAENALIHLGGMLRMHQKIFCAC